MASNCDITPPKWLYQLSFFLTRHWIKRHFLSHPYCFAHNGKFVSLPNRIIQRNAISNHRRVTIRPLLMSPSCPPSQKLLLYAIFSMANILLGQKFSWYGWWCIRRFQFSVAGRFCMQINKTNACRMLMILNICKDFSCENICGWCKSLY